MGTAVDQVRTRYDVNNSLRKGSFYFTEYTNGPDLRHKCVTKSECTGIDLLWTSTAASDDQCLTDVTLEYTANKNITIYYGIYNEKSSDAKLDYVSVQISTSSNPNSGTWYELKKANPGTISGWGKKTGSITFNLSTDCPSGFTFNPLTQYYLCVRAGDTNQNQKWDYSWFDSTYTTGSIPWHNITSSGKKGYTSAVQFQRYHDGEQVLTDNKNKNLNVNHPIFGRSTEHAACFRISPN